MISNAKYLHGTGGVDAAGIRVKMKVPYPGDLFWMEKTSEAEVSRGHSRPGHSVKLNFLK